MYVNELLAGRFTAPPRLTEFDCVETSSDLMVTGPIEMRSTCAHHLMPIFGSAIIGVVAADGRIIGLSKYDRVVHHFARRFQVQEELTRQIGDYLMERTAPRGLAVRVRAVHMCKTHRGVLASHEFADDQQRLLRRAQGRPAAQGRVPRGMSVRSKRRAAA